MPVFIPWLIGGGLVLAGVVICDLMEDHEYDKQYKCKAKAERKKKKARKKTRDAWKQAHHKRSKLAADLIKEDPSLRQDLSDWL